MYFAHQFTSVRALARLHIFIATVFFALVGAGCKDEVTNVNNVTTVYTSADLTDPAIMPAVTSTYPPTGVTGPFNVFTRASGTSKGHFVLTFNKLILRSSVLGKTVRISGFDRPVITVLQTGRSFYDNVLSFLIRDSIGGSIMPYPVGRPVTVVVDTTIMDVNGNRLAAPFSFVFTPEPNFRVVGFSPLDGTMDVTTGTVPEVYFNSPVGGTIISSLSISPGLGGNWRTQSSDSFYIRYSPLATALPFNTPFTLTVNSDAHDAAGRLIDRQYLSHFTSIPFRVTSTSPYAGQARIPLNTSINIYTSGIVDTGTIRTSFTLSPSSPGSFYIYVESYLGYSCYPTSLHQNTTYTVSLSSGVKALDGTSLTPYSFTFTTEAFNVQYTYPADGMVNTDVSSWIYVSLNGNIDTSTARTSFSISPTVPSGNFIVYDQSNSFNFTHDGLIANTTYTVTLSTALKTNAGDNLSSPYSFSFKTRP